MFQMNLLDNLSAFTKFKQVYKLVHLLFCDEFGDENCAASINIFPLLPFIA